MDENLRRASALLGVDAARILYLSQVHGVVARFYREPCRRDSTITLEGDSIGGSYPGTAYGVRSADCLPVLIADDTSGAVMAVHAGWRGVAGGAVAAAVRCLRDQVGAQARLLAAIGPHISASAFEVSAEVAAELSAACPIRGEEVVSRPAGGRPHVDLRLLVTRQLCSLGLENEAIDQVGGCTFREPNLYFSFRRDGKRSGRHLSAIVPRSPA